MSTGLLDHDLYLWEDRQDTRMHKETSSDPETPAQRQARSLAHLDTAQMTRFLRCAIKRPDNRGALRYPVFFYELGDHLVVQAGLFELVTDPVDTGGTNRCVVRVPAETTPATIEGIEVRLALEEEGRR